MSCASSLLAQVALCARGILPLAVAEYLYGSWTPLQAERRLCRVRARLDERASASDRTLIGELDREIVAQSAAT